INKAPHTMTHAPARRRSGPAAFTMISPPCSLTSAPGKSLRPLSSVPTARVARRGFRQPIISERLAQLRLQELARGGVRQFVDKRHIVGHPPFRDLGPQEFEQFVAGDVA